MKKRGILHAELSAHLARLGHTDTFLVVDSGFPVPPQVPTVDLRVVFGLPRWADVLRPIAAEVAIEGGWYATEVVEANPESHRVLLEAVPSGLFHVSHDELKVKAAVARFAVRTAEDTPYSNVLLQAGVAFDV